MQAPTIHSYELQIVLWEAAPPVWRRIRVPANITLKRLHDAIQAAMGWQNTHLFYFRYGPVTFGIPDPDGDDWDPPIMDARRLRLKSLRLEPHDCLTYIYDFGDFWVHVIKVAAIMTVSVAAPQVLDGDGVCPPEDVGGSAGYQRFLEVLANPDDPEYEDLSNWAKSGWTPPPFQINAARARVDKDFRRRPAGDTPSR